MVTPPQKTNLLLTGPSGVGKSELIKKIATANPHLKVRGFLSEVIMEAGQRTGWRLDPLNGQGGVYIGLGIESPHKLETRLGTYGIDLTLLERLVDSELRLENGADLYLIDEISRTGVLSPKFMSAVTALLDSGKPVIAAIHSKADGFVRQVRERSDAEMWEVTPEKREGMPARIMAWLKTSSIGSQII